MATKEKTVPVAYGLDQIHGARAREGRQGNTDIARATQSRKNLGPPITHDGMRSQSRDASFNQPDGNLKSYPDAGGPLPTDPEKQHGSSKSFPAPAIHPGTPSRPDRGHETPRIEHAIFGEAVISGATKLPDHTIEEH